MKNLLFFLLLIPAALFGQAYPGDSLPELPYRTDYYNDFENNITGWANFNSGAVFHTGSQMRITNGAGGNRGGILFDYTNEASTPYRVMFHVDSMSAGTQGIMVYSQWSTKIDTAIGTGWHTFYFTTDASPGGFGNKLILSMPSAGADTVWVSELTYGRINEGRDIYSIGEIEDSIGTRLRNVGAIYGNDFEYDLDGIAFFGKAAPSGPIDGALRFEATTGGHIVCIGCNEFSDTSSYEVWVDITIVDSAVTFRSVWGANSNFSQPFTVTESGQYNFKMYRRGPQADAQLDGLCAYTASGGIIQINDIIIRSTPYNPVNAPYVTIGPNAQVTNISGNPFNAAAVDGGIAIGLNALTRNEGIAIGDSAQATYDPTYGTAAGDDMLAIGHKSKSYGWRNSAIGNRTHAAGQSSTAIGTGAVALTSHGIALGRGSFLGIYNSEMGNTLNTDAAQLYLSNGWAHRFDTPLSGIGIGEDPTPSDVEVKIFGQDAYDSRAVPSDFNVAAGHLGLYAGRGTGTGEGGELRFYTAPQNAVSQNAKNNSIMSGKFDSDANISDGTDLWLLDRSDDTMKRVKIKDTSSAGSNKIVGFARLYIE